MHFSKNGLTRLHTRATSPLPSQSGLSSRPRLRILLRVPDYAVGYGMRVVIRDPSYISLSVENKTKFLCITSALSHHNETGCTCSFRYRLAVAGIVLGTQSWQISTRRRPRGRPRPSRPRQKRYRSVGSPQKRTREGTIWHTPCPRSPC